MWVRVPWLQWEPLILQQKSTNFSSHGRKCSFQIASMNLQCSKPLFNRRWCNVRVSREKCTWSVSKSARKGGKSFKCPLFKHHLHYSSSYLIRASHLNFILKIKYLTSTKFFDLKEKWFDIQVSVFQSRINIKMTPILTFDWETQDKIVDVNSQPCSQTIIKKNELWVSIQCSLLLRWRKELFAFFFCSQQTLQQVI